MIKTMKEEIRQYYGERLQSNKDLQTSACCTTTPPPAHIQNILNNIDPEITSKYYGCGLIAPDKLRDLTVLDLGCGTGQDVYVLSALVGQNGYVVGVDMTEQQLQVAVKHQHKQTRNFGFSRINTQFMLGDLQDLSDLNFEPECFDVIVSNCVLNLCEDKEAVLKQAYQLLKPGGEFYFSDVYADRRIKPEFKTDPVLAGECLSGALYWNDFIQISKQAGFLDPRLVSSRPIELLDEHIQQKLGGTQFYSATYRLFKIPELEPACEDYGQAVKYRGTVKLQPNSLTLDSHHSFPTGKIVPVCGNTYRMLADTRFKEDFEFFGSWETHFGIFEGCGLNIPFEKEEHKLSCC